jgi:multiple antibiotic resistance protein
MQAVEDMSFIKIAVSIFIVMNAVGQIPLFIAILAPYEARRQKIIILRELIFALVLLLLFTFFGNEILDIIGITRSIIGIAGGILLFLIALSMIFPKEKTTEGMPRHEPMFVPLAMPVISGPGSIAMLMLFAQETGRPFMVAGAVILAWIPSVLVLLVSSYIRNFLGEKGLQAVERLGGMIVCLIGIQMFSSGVISLIKENFP